MATFRYSQFCALARAAEILGERWTLPILREILIGPRRFSDLRRRLDGISSSVLTERLGVLEARGLVRRTTLEPPAASVVYELTEDGRALEPGVLALIRWGARFLLPPRRGDRLDPDWAFLALAACARRGPTPRHAYVIRMPRGGQEVAVYVAGGSQGTTVSRHARGVDVDITTTPAVAFGLMSGVVKPREAQHDGRARVEGDLKAFEAFPRLFEVDMGKPAQRSRTEETAR